MVGILEYVTVRLYIRECVRVDTEKNTPVRVDMVGGTAYRMSISRHDIELLTTAAGRNDKRSYNIPTVSGGVLHINMSMIIGVEELTS
jgi:hypothetical protein